MSACGLIPQQATFIVTEDNWSQGTWTGKRNEELAERTKLAKKHVLIYTRLQVFSNFSTESERVYLICKCTFFYRQPY